MIFRQLFEPESSTYTYLLADEATREAVLIDPVRETTERDLEQLESLGLTLRYTLETHVHADHITGAWLLKQKTGCQTVVAAAGGAQCADLQPRDRDVIRCGSLRIEVRATPGHTNGCVSYVLAQEGLAFTGDALLVRGCGRTDFQQGDARALYQSVRDQILSLPPDTRLYPAHDYKGRTVTTVWEERALNPRLKDGISEDEFARIMAGLKLALPRKIKESVPANLACGKVDPIPPTVFQGFVGGEGI